MEGKKALAGSDVFQGTCSRALSSVGDFLLAPEPNRFPVQGSVPKATEYLSQLDFELDFHIEEQHAAHSAAGKPHSRVPGPQNLHKQVLPSPPPILFLDHFFL